MAWSIIRMATVEDREALERAAVRFCRRHGINTADMVSGVEAVECEVTTKDDRGRKLAALWRRVVRRTLGDARADGIAHGAVGYHVD